MYLTKINMDLRNRSVQQGFRDCTDMHRNIQKIFNSSRLDSHVLYRLVSKGNNSSAYIMSSVPINEDMLDPKSGFSFAGCRCMDNFESKIADGNVYSFDLVAFPSKKKSFDDAKNSKRYFLCNSTEQIEWLTRKGELCGFVLNSVCSDKFGSISSIKKEHKMRFSPVHFYGSLTITDREAFINSWKNGIGPEKAYGMGMLIIR